MHKHGHVHLVGHKGFNFKEGEPGAIGDCRASNNDDHLGEYLIISATPITRSSVSLIGIH